MLMIEKAARCCGGLFDSRRCRAGVRYIELLYKKKDGFLLTIVAGLILDLGVSETVLARFRGGSEAVAVVWRSARTTAATTSSPAAVDPAGVLAVAMADPSIASHAAKCEGGGELATTAVDAVADPAPAVAILYRLSYDSRNSIQYIATFFCQNRNSC